MPKKKRTPKTSKGVHGGGGRLTAPHGQPRLSTVAKVLMGKGMLVNVEKIGKNTYLGATQPSLPVFDKEQALENKRLYPHLFEEQPRRSTR